MSGEDREVFRDRFAAYMLKTIREAKVHTSWLNQNHEHENAMLRFITRLLDETNGEFLHAFRSFQDKIARFGMLNSLGQLLLKMTAPGVPDIYQGNEIWSFCLVDPDNRRPVDFEKRWAMLTELQQTFAHAEQPLVELVKDLLQTPDDGRVKMYVSWKTLTCRREHPELFEQGGYISLQAAGGRKEHVCAFLRTYGETTLLVAVPRLVVQLLNKDATRMPLGKEVWSDTRLLLPEGMQERNFENILTGEKIVGRKRQTGLYAADLFARFPLTLLMTS
jgi:(1->4)-alpha-D-glucan 1-alpha-D-glucosylmutase